MTAEESFYVTDTPTHFTYAAYLLRLGKKGNSKRLTGKNFSAAYQKLLFIVPVV